MYWGKQICQLKNIISDFFNELLSKTTIHKPFFSSTTESSVRSQLTMALTLQCSLCPKTLLVQTHMCSTICLL